MVGSEKTTWDKSMNVAHRGHAPTFSAEAADPERMRVIVERYLRVPGACPVEVVACQVGHKRRNGPRSLIHYDVTFRDSASGDEWTHVVGGITYGGQRTRKAWERLQRQQPTASSATGATLVRAAYVPELDLLLQVFPFDHQLPALEPLMSGPLPGLLALLLSQFGPGEWQLEAWGAESMRYRVDLRASVRLTVRAREAATGETAARRFYAKIYASEGQAERAWGVQQDVAAALGGGDKPLSIAPPVAYLPEARVLVQAEVPGPSLRHVLRHANAKPEEAIAAVRGTARALAALHRLPVTPPAHWGELGRRNPQRLRRTAALLRSAHPELAPVVTEIEEGIMVRLAAIDELPAVPIHGDLEPSHVVFDNDRVVLLDFDKFAAGEPMLDVTNLLSRLYSVRRIGLSSLKLARTFIEEYFRCVPAAWEQRLVPYYAWALLGRECRIPLALEEAHKVLAGRAWWSDPQFQRGYGNDEPPVASVRPAANAEVDEQMGRRGAFWRDEEQGDKQDDSAHADRW